MDAVLYGVAKKDAGVKPVKLQCQVTPIFKDHLTKILNCMPEGVYENPTEFLRSIISIGALVAADIAALNHPRMKTVASAIKILVEIEMDNRADEFVKRTKEAISKLSKSDNPNRKEKLKRLERLLDDMDVGY